MNARFFTGLLALALGVGGYRMQTLDLSGPVRVSSEAVSGGPPVLVAAAVSHGFYADDDWRSQVETLNSAQLAGVYRSLIARGEAPGKEVLNLLFRAWLRVDPEAAFTAAMDLPEDYTAGAGIFPDFLEWALMENSGGFAKVVKWLPRLQGRQWDEKAPSADWVRHVTAEEAAAVFADGLNAGRFGNQLLKQYTASWAETDLPAVLAWHRSLDPARRDAAFSGIVKSWAAQDPQGVLDYLAGDATTGERQHAAEALGRLAETDPKSAMDWWETHLGVDEDRQMVRKIFAAWYARSPEESLAYATQVEAREWREAAIEAWGMAVPMTGMMEALAQAQNPRDLKSLTPAFFSRPPVNEAEVQLLKNAARDAVGKGWDGTHVAVIGRTLARWNPAEAFEWVKTLPEDYQKQAAPFVLSQWRDRVAAVQAMEDLPVGILKEAARVALTPNPFDPFQ